MMSFGKLAKFYDTINCFNKQILPIGCKLLQNVNIVNVIRRQGKSRRSFQPYRPKVPSLRNNFSPWLSNAYKEDVKMQLPQATEEQEKIEMDIYNNINNQIATQTHSRLFAIVGVAGKQFKVTESDIIIIEGYWPPKTGDDLKLEKLLLIGSTDFTIVGRPLLNPEMAYINATVIDKTYSHTKYMFYHKPRKQYRRLHFARIPQTMLRINSINLLAPIHEKKEVEGLDRIY